MQSVSISETQASQWTAKYSCPQPGVESFNEWSVRGFYDDKFDDPWNLNLGENVVSLITAIATSFSIILFVDIVFRVHVRAKNSRVRPEVVQRRQVLEDFSNPINLPSLVFRRITPNRSAESEGSAIWSPYHGLSRWTYGNLIFMGVLIVLIEYLFIFLATNQTKAYDIRIDAVPIFEFEDRGCEILDPPDAQSCDYVPLTEKAGFDSRASIQICSANLVYATEKSSLNDSFYFYLEFNVLNVDGVQVTIRHSNTTVTQTTRMGVYLEQNRKFYIGMQDVRPEPLISALLKRLERTNVTVLANSTTYFVSHSETSGSFDQLLLQRSVSNLSLRTQQLNGTVVSILVDASEVDLRETFQSHHITGKEDENEKIVNMLLYLSRVMNSIMFPTGRGRGIFSVGGESIFLDEDTTPVVYYNRPWIGVVASLIICCTLLLTWIVFAALGLEGDVESQLAWENFFKDTEVSNTDDLE